MEISQILLDLVMTSAIVRVTHTKKERNFEWKASDEDVLL